MKTFKIVGALFFIFCLFVMPVSAFEDNFDDGQFSYYWNVVSGSWSNQTGGYPTETSVYYLYSSMPTFSTSEIKIDVASLQPNYVSFWAKFTKISTGGGLEIYFSPTQYIKIDRAYFDLIQPSGTTRITVTEYLWHNVVIERSGNNFIYSVYDTSGALVDSQTISADTVDDTTEIKIIGTTTGYVGVISIDDIIVSSIPPTAESGINWDLEQYTEGDTASYTWMLENSFWQDLLYKYQIQILKDGLEIDTVGVSQTGTRYQDVDIAGTYEVKLQYSGLWPTNWQSIDGDSVNVIPQVDSYINVPQTAPQRTNFTVIYLYGSTPSNGLILMKRLDETTGNYETVEFDLLDSDKQGGVTYTRNMSLHSTGTYKITLVHDEQVDEIYDVIEITSLYVPPIETVGNSSISSDKSTYAIGETIFAQYAVDYTNYTTYNVNMEIYNIDKDIISYSVQTIDQISYISQTIPITNEFFSGDHHLRLTSYDNTGTKVAVLANKSITIGLVNDGGFGLSLSKYDVMQLEQFVIKAISPTSANIRVWSVERDVQVGTLMTINGSTYLNYAIPRTGNYEITLSSGGLEITKQYITVHEGFVDGEVDEEIEDEVTQSTVDMVINFLSMPAFWGMIIWVGVVGGASQSKAVNRSSTGYIAFAFGNILAIVGLFAPYTMYILVILWIGAGVFFKLGKEAAGSEEY